MSTPVDEEALKTLFTEARTHRAWLDRPVDDALLRRLYELTRMGPTLANALPLRVLFVKGAAKERLRPALDAGNVEKTMQAPVTAVLAVDTAFYEKMPALFPARPTMREFFAEMPEAARDAVAKQSAHLQAGYFLLAARALGLDCGPMGGFNASKVDEAFLQGTRWRSTLLVNLGYGDASKLFPRLPRLDFEEACKLVSE